MFPYVDHTYLHTDGIHTVVLNCHFGLESKFVMIEFVNQGFVIKEFIAVLIYRSLVENEFFFSLQQGFFVVTDLVVMGFHVHVL